MQRRVPLSTSHESDQRCTHHLASPLIGWSSDFWWSRYSPPVQSTEEIPDERFRDRRVARVALNIATGEVLHDTRKSHASKDVLAFFKWIDLHVARDLDVHVVLDNLSAHKAPPVAEWLAHPKRTRWHLHYTPTSSSWLNLVEGWFAQLTNRRLRHGSFDSVAALTDAIDVWTSHWNDDPKPFVWHATAKQIITKVRRGRAALTHQTKSATDH